MAKKIIVSETPGEQIAHQVRFTPERFNELIFDKGYDVWIDKALRCPCSVENAGNPLPDCDNCLGMGWFYIDRTETRVTVQGMKADVRYENWSRDTTGMARITSRAIDKLCFMDKIILQDVEGYYNEIIRTKTKDDKTFCYTMYEIVEIESIYLFETQKTKLRRLIKDTDYTIDPDIETKIILSSEFNASPQLTLTIRYRHLQTYHVIDMNRDIVKVRSKGCKMPDENLKEMPISGMIRKAHYLFDNRRFDEDNRLLENSKES